MTDTSEEREAFEAAYLEADTVRLNDDKAIFWKGWNAALAWQRSRNASEQPATRPGRSGSSESGKHRTFTRDEITSFITPGDNGIIATLARQLLAAMEEDERLATAGVQTKSLQP